MIILTQDQVLSMHKDMIQKFGGSSGIRDAKLLESALNAPFQSVLGQDAYPSLIQKAARIGYGIISNHPFVDGNKRTGAHVMLVFLMLNNLEMDYEQSELIAIVMKIASGENQYEDLVEWLKKHQV